jgi:hypothetical protein
MDATSTNDDITPDPDPARLLILHDDIIDNIVKQMDNTSTLATMMRVSRRMYKLAAPRLYCEVSVTAENGMGPWAGLELSDTPVYLPGGSEESAKNRKRTDIEEETLSTIHAEEKFSIPALYSKRELISMIRHLNIHEVPLLKVCDQLASLAFNQKIRQSTEPFTISIRPTAVWQLINMRVHEVHRGCHPLVRFLQLLDCEHLCIQMPVLDIDAEAEYFQLPPRLLAQYLYSNVPFVKARQELQAALIKPSNVNKNFFGLIEAGCRNVTIHNLVVSMTDQTLASLASPTATLRAFYRPCVTADGELTNRKTDIPCINHRDKSDIATGGVKLCYGALRRSTNVEFIDIDWVRGKYQPERDDGALRSIEQMVEVQIGQTPEAEREGWGEKSFKMAREVEPCRCCQKGQLSVAEVSQNRSWFWCYRSLMVKSSITYRGFS